jgi:hypothetical protein
MTDARQAAVHPTRNFPERQTSRQQTFHLLLRWRPFSRMFLRLSRLQPVLLQPIADRRFVLADALADRFEGHSLGQALFEELLLHGCIFPGDADRKMRMELS